MPINWWSPVPIDEGLVVAAFRALEAMGKSELLEEDFEEFVCILGDQGILTIHIEGRPGCNLYQLAKDDMDEFNHVVNSYIRPIIGFRIWGE